MAVTQIWTPHRYAERFCIWGFEGAGKSTAILNALRYDIEAHGWVIDMDYSFAYERLVATEYPDVEERLHVFQIDADMEEFDGVWNGDVVSTDGYTMPDGREAAGHWLGIDPTTATWQMAQSHWLTKAYGDDGDMGMLFAELRTEAVERVQRGEKRTRAGTVDSEFAADKAEKMQWPIINKIYEDKFLKRIHKWRGHMIMVCEGDAVRKDASAEEQKQYGFIGVKPKGQKSIPYVAATNLYFEHTNRDEWRMTSVKDRGRALVDKEVFTDFAIDYLVNIAGWAYAEDDEG